ncbi:DEAD/DEAH box helicase [Treponema sp.]|uniref:DEAD/DEAH box helicase n=1 Tax=Treponema sp. TaxID=166 RepID=UPI003FD7FFA0
MKENQYLIHLKDNRFYTNALRKLVVEPEKLINNEKTFLLSSAILFMKVFMKDKRCKTFFDLAYYIILKYSLSFNDFQPLYDISINAGFFPITHVILENDLIEKNHIFDIIADSLINYKFTNQDDIIETFEQKLFSKEIINSLENNIAYVAPTSFGKSKLIISHIHSNIEKFGAKNIKYGIIVPSKSLLQQTANDIKKERFPIKIITHDEMYDNDTGFIAVFTQERALRLLERNSIFFDILYIDEAHNIFERDSRAILLSRLLKLNRRRNQNSKFLFFSPLVSNPNNLLPESTSKLFERHIPLNMKESELYIYQKTGELEKYNRFLDTKYPINKYNSLFDFLLNTVIEKNFFYVATPKKIQDFSYELSKHLPDIHDNGEIKKICDNLSKYVHSDFLCIPLLKKGIVFLHGKIPDPIKDYLETKFKELSELKFLVANTVILEGINLPIFRLFILSSMNLDKKALINLLGRVNRLNFVFSNKNNLAKLLPQIFFVENDEYNRKNWKLESKMKLLTSSIFDDEVKNPTLANYTGPICSNAKERIKQTFEDNKTKKLEETFFSTPDNENDKLKKQLVSLNLSSVYDMSERFCQTLKEHIQSFLLNNEKNNVLDRLFSIFIKDLEQFIIDDEFKRLQKSEALSYYKLYFERRKFPLSEKIALDLSYWKTQVEKGNRYMYIGKSFGECNYNGEYNPKGKGNVYIDCKRKNKMQMVNSLVIKQKIEEDFANFTLNKFFEFMLDQNLMSQDEYNEYVYGTNDVFKLKLIKLGIPISILEKIILDKQLSNVSINIYNNIAVNSDFLDYINKQDDFYAFQVKKYFC